MVIFTVTNQMLIKFPSQHFKRFHPKKPDVLPVIWSVIPPLIPRGSWSCNYLRRNEQVWANRKKFQPRLQDQQNAQTPQKQ